MGGCVNITGSCVSFHIKVQTLAFWTDVCTAPKATIQIWNNHSLVSSFRRYYLYSNVLVDRISIKFEFFYLIDLAEWLKVWEIFRFWFFRVFQFVDKKETRLYFHSTKCSFFLLLIDSRSLIDCGTVFLSFIAHCIRCFSQKQRKKAGSMHACMHDGTVISLARNADNIYSSLLHNSSHFKGAYIGHYTHISIGAVLPYITVLLLDPIWTNEW